MMNRAGKSQGTMGLQMMLNMAGVPALLGKLLSAKGAKPTAATPASKSTSGDVGAAKIASVSLGKLEAGSKSGTALKGKLREDGELKPQQDLKCAKSKGPQTRESKVAAKPEAPKAPAKVEKATYPVINGVVQLPTMYC